MKRIFFPATALVMLLNFSACESNRDRQVQSEQDGRELEGKGPSSSSAPTDSSGLTNNLDRPTNPDSTNEMGATSASNATGQYTGDTAVRESEIRTDAPRDHTAFLREAAVGNLLEIQSSQMALKTSKNPEIRRFAETMVAHHQQNMNELKPLARRNNAILPTSLSDEKMREVNRLTAMTGSAFDRAYLDLQLKAHQQTVGKFESIGQSLGDTDIRAYVAKSLPVLRNHLEMVSAMQDKMGKATQ